MFLRSFDTKRYQELQAQKAKILEKQRKLIKIKECKGPGRTAGVEGEGESSSGGDKASESSDNTVVEDSDGGTNTGDFGVTMTLMEEEEEEGEGVCNGTYGSGGARMDEGKNVAVNGQTKTVATNGKKSAKSKETKSSKSSAPRVQSIYADLKAAREKATTAKAETGGSQTPTQMQYLTVPTVIVTQAPATEPVKEYTIIARRNQDALQRETEMLDNEQSSGVYSLAKDVITDASQGKQCSPHQSPSRKTNTDAYAVVDVVDRSKQMVDEINGNSEKHVSYDNSVKNNTDKYKKSDIRKPIKPGSDYKDIISMYKYSKMSRSAGYHGDIDTSTSSLEPDYCDLGQLDALTSRLTGTDRLVITEEQLSSLHTVTSSSSG